ncbi:MAG: LysM peptidoglycan-binding domain-containing protein [Candidatus Limnocylindrales bacterium]
MPDPAETDRQSPGGDIPGGPPAGSEPAPETPVYWLASAELGVPTLGEARAAPESAPASGSASAPEPAPASGSPSAASLPDSSAAGAAGSGPPPRAGVVLGAEDPDRSRAHPARASSVATRLSALLAILLVAGVVGYGLAFLSAELIGRANSAGPPAAASARASAGPTAAASGIPASASPPATSPASPSPTPTAIATTVPSGLASPAPASPQIHLVAPGETLTSIAARYGLSVQALAAANGITDLDRIYVGQKLVIPAP